MDKKRSMPLLQPGVSTLLVVFALLVLLSFALLALSTARSSQRLTESSLQAVSDYYAADTRAEELFARLREGELPEGIARSGSIYSYTCPVSQGQELQVELRQDGDAWTVLRWQTVAVAGPAAEETLNLWDGEITGG